jgi:hypothetical protein
MIVFQNVHSGSRLGNRLFQNAGLTLLAKKFNYTVYNYYPESNSYFLQLKECQEIGFNPHSGSIIKTNLVYYDDKSLLNLINGPNEIDHGISYTEYFQNLDFILTYKQDIKNLFTPIQLPLNNDVYIHVRIDGIPTEWNPGIDYYTECIRNINFDNGYISSDLPEHEIVQELIKKYSLILIDKSPVETINFAKTCNHIVMSSGTFSWWIGFLSNAQNIFFPSKHNTNFHPYIFLPEWTKV